MALGTVLAQQRFERPEELLGDRLRGIYRLLADYGEAIFPHDYFADCYTDSVRGRPTVPARVLATVMVLQAHEASPTATPATGWNETWPGRPPRACMSATRPSTPPSW